MAVIRVHKVRELGDGSIEVAFHGSHVDGTYIQGLLNKDKGASVSEPKQNPGTEGVLMYLTVRGTEANPMSKARVVELLTRDAEVEVMPGAADA